MQFSKDKVELIMQQENKRKNNVQQTIIRMKLIIIMMLVKKCLHAYEKQDLWGYGQVWTLD